MYSNRDSVGTTATQISQARKSLRSTSLLNREEFKGNTQNPSYAIDADIEGTYNSIDRADENLTVLELGRKYQDVFGDAELVIADMSGTMFEDLHKPIKPYPGALEAVKL